MCEQGEGPGQGTGGGKDFGALTHHLQQQPQQNSHTTTGGQGCTENELLPGVLLGKRREKGGGGK